MKDHSTSFVIVTTTLEAEPIGSLLLIAKTSNEHDPGPVPSISHPCNPLC
jgi:hypothetical protein